jgi:hypothetical protein
MLKFDAEKDTLEIGNCQREPVRLNSVQVVESKAKK